MKRSRVVRCADFLSDLFYGFCHLASAWNVTRCFGYCVSKISDAYSFQSLHAVGRSKNFTYSQYSGYQPENSQSINPLIWPSLTMILRGVRSPCVNTIL